MSKEIINTSKAPQPIGPYNQAVKFGNLIFVSGQIALKEDGVSLIGESIEVETHQVMKNIKAILKATDLNFDNVVKISIFLKDLSLFNQVNKTYGQYFNPDSAPARETVEVSQLPKNANIEMSIIAGIE